jgi:hypothetical protein
MTEPNFRDLCAELAEKIDYTWGDIPEDVEKLINRARAALAEQPVGPTDEELDELFTEIDQSGESESWRAFARAVLARWGQS